MIWDGNYGHGGETNPNGLGIGEFTILCLVK